MTEECKRLLDSIGFVWTGVKARVDDVRWERIYQRLVAYKKEHNDTRVPQKDSVDPKLGYWVMKKRAMYSG